MSTIVSNKIDSLNGVDEVSIPTLDKRMGFFWVSFQGTGTVSIRDSYNVSSITDNSAGNYTVNFLNIASNNSYSVVCSSTNQVTAVQSPTVSSVNILTQAITGTPTDAVEVHSVGFIN